MQNVCLVFIELYFFCRNVAISKYNPKPSRLKNDLFSVDCAQLQLMDNQSGNGFRMLALNLKAAWPKRSYADADKHQRPLCL